MQFYLLMEVFARVLLCNTHSIALVTRKDVYIFFFKQASISVAYKNKIIKSLISK